MTASADRWSVVALDPQREPVFPDRCVRCGEAAPTRRLRQRVHLQAPAPHARVPRAFEVPVCGRCHLRRAGQRIALFGCLAMLLVIALRKAGVGPAAGLELPRFLLAAVLCGCVLAALFVGWLATRLRFDIAFDGRSLLFSFRNADAARAFAVRNGASVAPMAGAAAAGDAVFDREPSRWTPDGGGGSFGADHDD